MIRGRGVAGKKKSCRSNVRKQIFKQLYDIEEIRCDARCGCDAKVTNEEARDAKKRVDCVGRCSNTLCNSIETMR